MKPIPSKFGKIVAISMWQFIFLYLLVSQVSPPGAVLCLGVDGHVALEMASKEAGCKPLLDIASREALNFLSVAGRYSDKGHCGPCTDISISVSSSNKSVVHSRDVDLQIQATTLEPNPTHSLFLMSVKEGFLPKPPPAINQTTSFLQTTTLLC